MTTEVEAREAIYDRMIASWDTTLAVFTLAPKSFNPPAEANWVRLSVTHNDSQQRSLAGPLTGSRKFVRIGEITMQVFTPIDDGMLPNDVVVRAGRTLFEGVRFDGIRTFDAVPNEIGPEGDYFQTNLDIAFDYEEQK